MSTNISIEDNQPELDTHDILEQITEAFFALDREWRFGYVNTLACHVLQRERESLIGRNVWDEFSEAVGLRFEFQYRKAMEKQVAVQFEEYFQPLQKWFEVRAYPSGTGLYVYFRDISLRKQMEREIEHSNNIVSHAQRIAEIGVWEWDVKNDIIHWSDGARRIGQHPRTTGSFDFYVNHLVHEDDRDTVRIAIQDSLSGGPYDVEYRMRRPEGDIRIIHSQGQTLFDDTSEPVKMIGIARDITMQRDTERLLIESQERYRSLRHYNPDGICSLDLVGRILGVNPALEKLLGYTQDQLLSMSFVDLLLSEDTEEITDFLFASFQREEPTKLECRIKCRDGHTIDVYCTRVPIVTHGEIRGLYVIIQDITERKKAEMGLIQAEARYRLISENANDIISYSTPGGIMEYVSPASYKLLGYTPEEIIGNPGSFAYHPDDAPHIQTMTQRVLRGEANDRLEFRVRHKNGSYLWFETNIKPIRDDRGAIVHVFGVGRDITQRKAAETQLKESEEKYRTLIENSLNVIAVNDGTQWLYMNRAGLGLFGASCVDDIVGKPLHNFLHEDYHALCEARTRSILNEQRPAPLIEQKWYTLTGDIIETEVLAVPVIFENRRVVQLIIRDISERKQAEQILIQSEKLSAIGQLAAGIAHEVRNPLTALKGFLQLLHSKDDGANSQYFDIMQQEIARIEMISSEMLMLAKPQAMSFEERDVQLLLHSVTTLLETQALITNVQIVTEYEDVPPIQCVEHALKQVFVNIVKNAIEAMRGSGQITIRLKEVSGSVWIQVEDQGHGIPTDLLTKLGEPFFTTKQNGTGLGLMVTKKIIENHHGTIDFVSQVGIGTKVTIMIPVAG